MRQQLPDGDFFLAVLREVGDVLGDGIVQLDLPQLHHAHDRSGRRHDFRQRRHIEDGVDRHRLQDGIDGAKSERLAVDHYAVMADDAYHSRREPAWQSRSAKSGRAAQSGRRRALRRARYAGLRKEARRQAARSDARQGKNLTRSFKMGLVLLTQARNAEPLVNTDLSFGFVL